MSMQWSGLLAPMWPHVTSPHPLTPTTNPVILMALDGSRGQGHRQNWGSSRAADPDMIPGSSSGPEDTVLPCGVASRPPVADYSYVFASSDPSLSIGYGSLSTFPSLLYPTIYLLTIVVPNSQAPHSTRQAVASCSETSCGRWSPLAVF